MWLWGAYKCSIISINTVVFLTGCTCNEPNDTSYGLTVQQHVTVQEGLCVTVTCAFTIDPSKTLSPNSTGYWNKCPNNDTEYCFSKPALDKKPSIHVSNASNRDCSFTLIDADTRDTGKYEFRLEDGKDQQIKWTYRKHSIYITVTDLTDKPEIVLPEMLVAGQDVSLICRSPGRSCGTPPTFAWERNPDKAKSNSSFIRCEGKNMSISECKGPKITLRLSKDDHNTSITCKVTLPAVNRSTEKTVTLNVQSMKSSNVIQIRDIMIGFLGGITFALFAILIVKLITRIRKKDKPGTEPLSADSDRNELYMNVSPAAQDTPNSPKRNKEQEHPMEAHDEQALNYASINFPTDAPACPTVNGSELVYAQIRNKEKS